MKIYDDDDDKHDEIEIYFVSPIPYPYSKILFNPTTLTIRRLLSYPILSYPSKSKDEWYHHLVKKDYSIFIKDRERYLTIEKNK